MKRLHLLSAITVLSGALLPAMGVAHAQRAAGSYAQTTIFAALENGGVYRSSDGGDTWLAADSGLPQTDAQVTVLQAGGSNTIYAGTSGNGVYYSTDGGQRWQDDNGENSDLPIETVVGLAVDRRFGDTVFAAGQDGVVYSNFSGQSWSESRVGTTSNLSAITDDPGDPTTLLVGTENDGIYLSTDYGADWQSTSGIPANVTVHALAFAPHSAGVAYAATDDGIYQSVDDGNIWLPERRGIPDNTTMESIAVDPQHGATVVAGTSDGAFYRSTDGGTGWQYIDSTLSGAAVRSLIFDPAHPGSAYAGIGDSGGFYSSADAGVNWFPADTLPASPVLSLTLLSRPPVPTAAVPPVPNLPSRHYFPQSHHIVGGAFLYFFNKYGGVAVFGLPITEPFLENGQLVQYFERMRLVQTRTVVAVSALGTQVTAGRYFSPVTPFANRGSRRYFPATGHSLSGRFLIYWRSHHGALLFGAPISEPLYEQNGDGTGRTYLVQYFQNARMEYHPELSGSSYAVSLGLLGQQLLKQRGWL